MQRKQESKFNFFLSKYMSDIDTEIRVLCKRGLEMSYDKKVALLFAMKQIIYGFEKILVMPKEVVERLKDSEDTIELNGRVYKIRDLGDGYVELKKKD